MSASSPPPWISSSGDPSPRRSVYSVVPFTVMRVIF